MLAIGVVAVVAGATDPTSLYRTILGKTVVYDDLDPAELLRIVKLARRAGVEWSWRRSMGLVKSVRSSTATRRPRQRSGW